MQLALRCQQTRFQHSSFSKLLSQSQQAAMQSHMYIIYFNLQIRDHVSVLHHTLKFTLQWDKNHILILLSHITKNVCSAQCGLLLRPTAWSVSLLGGHTAVLCN